MSPGASRLLRYLPILIVILAAAWFFLGERPRRVDVDYMITAPGVSRVDVRIRQRGGPVEDAVTFGDGRTPLPQKEVEHPMLSPGTYQLEATLEWPDGRRQEVHRELEVGKGGDPIVVQIP